MRRSHTRRAGATIAGTPPAEQRGEATFGATIYITAEDTASPRSDVVDFLISEDPAVQLTALRIAIERELRGAAELADLSYAPGPRTLPLKRLMSELVRLGWAALNPYSHRGAYHRVADLSIYVARDARGTGVGSTLLGALEKRAKLHGFHKIVLFALSLNADGRRLYRNGYRQVGVFVEQGGSMAASSMS